MALREGEYVDPALRQAVTTAAQAQLVSENNPDEAVNKGLLKITEPPKYASGSALNEAVIKRARDKYYDPVTSVGLQKMKFATGQIENNQNSIGKIMSLYKLDKQAEEITRQRKSQEDAQRAAIIGSVLGIGGAIGGAMLAGPAGAAAGAQAGQAAGGGTGYLGANTKF